MRLSPLYSADHRWADTGSVSAPWCARTGIEQALMTDSGFLPWETASQCGALYSRSWLALGVKAGVRQGSERRNGCKGTLTGARHLGGFVTVSNKTLLTDFDLVPNSEGDRRLGKVVKSKSPCASIKPGSVVAICLDLILLHICSLPWCTLALLEEAMFFPFISDKREPDIENKRPSIFIVVPRRWRETRARGEGGRERQREQSLFLFLGIRFL